MAKIHNKPEIVKLKWSRAEVADMYGICTLTLMGWLEERGYKLRPRKAINLKEFEDIIAMFGDPRAYTAAERAKPYPKKGKS
jgi:hypothetical protein